MKAKTVAQGLSPQELERVRADFPALHQTVHGKPLVYLDNAATSHKPTQVIEAMDRFFRRDNSNVHRGVHELSQRATEQYEAAREKVARFVNAREAREVVFVRGATEAINLVASSYGRANAKAGDEVIVSGMEHHSNIVPWQLLGQDTGAKLKVIPIDDDGDLRLDEYERLLSPRTKLVAVTHVSNALGTVNPIPEITAAAHARGVPVLVDGAQAAAHGPVDVQALGADFYALSGHKMYAPTGIGALVARAELLEAMPPYQGGGDMIRRVTWEKTEYNEIPFKFEAGTPNVAGSIGLGAAVDYIESLGRDRIEAHEHALLEKAHRELSGIEGLRIIGTAKRKAAVVSFTLEDAHPHDIGSLLDAEGIAVRAGHHCAQPTMDRFGVPATTRASFAVYNTPGEVEALAAALRGVREVFR